MARELDMYTDCVWSRVLTSIPLSLSLSHSESARLHVQHDREADLCRRPQGMFTLLFSLYSHHDPA